MSVFSQLFNIGSGNLVSDPQRIPWNVAPESTCGTGIHTNAIDTIQPMTGAVCWGHLACGDVAQVSVDDTYATISSVADGAGVITNLVLPGVTAGSDVVTLRITIDGVVHTLAFTADNATDRFFSGLVETRVSASNNGWIGNHWGGAAFVSGLAFRRGYNVFIVDPVRQLCQAPCIRFESSLLVEMKCSDFSATTYRDYGAVIYVLDQ